MIEGASEVTIELSSPRGYPEEFQARIVGQDERTDCALLKIDAGRRLPALKLSSASHVEVADWIVVIGNPFGLEHSVTVGVVSYKGRTDVTPNGREGDYDYLQMDASINPGNSGGPVLDLQRGRGGHRQRGERGGPGHRLRGAHRHRQGGAPPPPGLRPRAPGVDGHRREGLLARGGRGVRAGPLGARDRRLRGARRTGPEPVPACARETSSSAWAPSA